MTNLETPKENTWPIPLVGNTLFVDNSTQERFQTCLRSAGYYVAHKRELNRPKPAQAFGKIIHKALELRYTTQSQVIDPGILQNMVSTVTKGFDDYTPPDDDFRTYDLAVATVKQYATQYNLEDFKVCSLPNGKPFVEFPFAIPLGEIAINRDMYVREPDGSISFRSVSNIVIVQKGKIDLVYEREGNIYGLDHKTTSIMGPQYFAEFELASQVHCYSWAIQNILGKLPSSYVINGLGIRKPTKSGKSLEFIRQSIPIFPALVDEWKTDALTLTSMFIDAATNNQLPKMTKWCVAKYGTCEYKAVCGLDPKLRYMSLYSNEFKNVTWDPLTE